MNDTLHTKNTWVDLDICQRVPEDVITHIISFLDDSHRQQLENDTILKHFELKSSKSCVTVDLYTYKEIFDDAFFVKNIQRSKKIIFDCTRIPFLVKAIKNEYKIKIFRANTFEIQDQNVKDEHGLVVSGPQFNFITKFFLSNNLNQIRHFIFNQSSIFDLPALNLDILEFNACRLSLTRTQNIFSNLTSKSLIIRDCYPGNMFSPTFCESVEHLTIDCSNTLSLVSFQIFWNFLENFTNLRSLQIFDSFLYGDWNSLIKEYQDSYTSFPSITELNVSGNTQFFVMSEWTEKFQRVFPNVEKISMVNCNLAQADVEPLQEWIERCKFQHVNVDENPGIQIMPSFCFQNLRSFSANQCTFPIANFLNQCLQYQETPLKQLTICIRTLEEFWKTWNVLTRQNGRVTHITMNLKQCTLLHRIVQDIKKTRLLCSESYEDSNPVSVVVILPVLQSWIVRSELQVFFRECFPSQSSTLTMVEQST